MKSFREFIYNSQPEYSYRVKMTLEPVPQIMDRMEKHLVKYDVQEVSKPVKLMLQSHNVDFPGSRGVEIWYVDIVTKLPVSPRVLAMELGEAVGISENQIKIRGANEPIEQDQRADLADGTEKEYVAKMGTDYTAEESPKIEPLFGDEYNSRFMQELAKAQKERAVKFSFAAKVPDAKHDPLKDVKSGSPISGSEQEKYGMPETFASPRKTNK